MTRKQILHWKLVKDVRSKNGKIIVTKKNAKISIGYRGKPKSEVYLIAKNIGF